MKIRSITLDNIRQFTAPVRIGGIAEGLNVLSEPNEHGKSTVFDAIQALFFKPHGSRDKEMTALRPHAGGAPEVTIEVETDDGLFTLRKRWMQKPAATVHRDGRLIAQSDAAEAWIGQLLGGDAGGPAGLVWVRQGITDLVSGSKKEQDAALAARRDLMSSVGAEVEALTGGRRMDAALERCRAELAHYATATGKPRANAPWKQAQDDLARLTEERDALLRTRQDLHEALSERKRARRDLQEHEAPEIKRQRQERLKTAQETHAAAERHAQELETEAGKLQMAQLKADTAQRELDSLRAALSESAEATQELQRIRAQAQTARAELEDQRRHRDQADRDFEQARERLKTAERDHAQALRARAAREGAARRRELAGRIEQAQEARKKMEAAAGAARIGPDAEALRRLETLDADYRTAIAARNATAPQLIARYAEGRDGTIRHEGGALPEGQPLPLPRTTQLTIDGIGKLEVRPGQPSHDDQSVETALARLQSALADMGAEDLDAARTAAMQKARARHQHDQAAAVLAGLAPDGIDALHKALGAIPEPEDTEATLDLDEAAERRAKAADALDAARLERETASDRLADLRERASRAEATIVSLEARATRAAQAVSTLGETTEADCAARAASARTALDDARLRHAQKSRAAPDLASTRAALERAVSVDRQAREEISRLRPLLARLDERIGRASGEAVEERLAEAEQTLKATGDTLARIEHEVAVLMRLERALEAARNEARERYFAPVARELKPLLHLLWPEAELTWGEESLLPDTLVRDGRAERIDILSGGTREQVALLVRLAFARMLARAGRAAPVILDDALVYTDDDRIERMFDALHRQAGDLQIIVLTCRQRAFRDLGGQALRLDPLPGDTA